MKSLLPLLVCSLFFNFSSRSQAVLKFTGCPNVNIGVARAGTNSDVTNPYYIYSVNTSTGAVSLLPGGPLLNPANPNQNLQVNAVGVNQFDGFMYGLETENSGNNPKFLRFDYGYGVTVLGNVQPPTSPSGMVGIVNSAAGDIDRSDNYYFTGSTINLGPPASYTLDKLFLGKISAVSTLAGTPVPTYYEIDYTDAACGNYISTLSSDPVNSGIKDITYNPVTNSFFIYATYKPNGTANFSGQLLELRAIPESSPLKYKMTCYAPVNTHTAETAGTLIDNAGNFLVLLTDGTIGKMQSSGPAFNYNGVYISLNNATGLPNPLRGDLASCGGAAGGPLPLTLSSFKGSTRDCKTNFLWTSENESNLKTYELEQSLDNTVFTKVGMVAANNNGASSYALTLSSGGSMAYYRLKMVEKDGRYTYSAIIPIKNSCTPQFGFTVRTNPVVDVLKLNWYGMNATTMNVKIYNAQGVLVLSSNSKISAGSSVLDINTSGFLPGMYYIKAFDPKTRTTLQERFLKQ